MKLTVQKNCGALAVICLFISISPLVQAQADGAHATERVAAGDLAAAVRLNEGVDGLPNYKVAFAMFQASSLAGNSDASAWLGSMLLLGHGTQVDLTRAVALISDSADKKSPVGLRFMGLLYARGAGVSQDYKKARLLYEKATEFGDPPSYGRLGMLNILGLGEAADFQKGKSLLLKGSDLGDPWAMVELGRLYATSSKVPDYTAALAQYRKAAALGNRIGAFRAGRLYQQGKGTAVNFDLARDLYMQAVKKGQPDAQLALGGMYERGDAVPRDPVSAFALYGLAADANLPEAQAKLNALAVELTSDQRAAAVRLRPTFHRTLPAE